MIDIDAIRKRAMKCTSCKVSSLEPGCSWCKIGSQHQLCNRDALKCTVCSFAGTIAVIDPDMVALLTAYEQMKAYAFALLECAPECDECRTKATRGVVGSSWAIACNVHETSNAAELPWAEAARELSTP